MNTQWSAEQLQDRVLHAIASVNTIDKDSIGMNHNLSSLGIDNLDLVDLIMDFEESLQIQVTDEDIERVHSVGDLVELLKSKAGIII